MIFKKSELPLIAKAMGELLILAPALYLIQSKVEHSFLVGSLFCLGVIASDLGLDDRAIKELRIQPSRYARVRRMTPKQYRIFDVMRVGVGWLGLLVAWLR